MGVKEGWCGRCQGVAGVAGDKDEQGDQCEGGQQLQLRVEAGSADGFKQRIDAVRRGGGSGWWEACGGGGLRVIATGVIWWETDCAALEKATRTRSDGPRLGATLSGTM